MTRPELPRLLAPNVETPRQGPELAVLTALDAALVATHAALDARHGDLHLAGWAPDAAEEIRVAAAIVASARALRQLLADYDDATHTRIFDELPF